MRSIGKSSGAASVVLVGLDNESMGLVRETLATEAVLPNQSVPFGDAIEIIDRAMPDVVIVGLGESIDAALQLGEDLSRELPSITLVALASSSDADVILKSMRVGYKEFVVLPGDSSRLRQVVHDAAFQADEEEDKGLVVSIVGAKGGVGTTVLATNLAAELAAIHRVICMDFDFGMGDVASTLDLKPRDTIADLLERAGRLDERSLTASVAVHRSKVHIMPVPENMAMMPQLSGDEIYSVINTASKAYQFVVIDCGSYFDEAVATALQVSDIVLLVTTPDVTAVRDAFRKIRMFAAVNVEKDRIRLVVNRWNNGAYVSESDIAANLDMPVSQTVRRDDATVHQAVNEGKLIREVNRKSDVSRDISALVGVLTDDEDPGEEPESESKGFFASLFGRG